MIGREKLIQVLACPCMDGDCFFTIIYEEKDEQTDDVETTDE